MPNPSLLFNQVTTLSNLKILKILQKQTEMTKDKARTKGCGNAIAINQNLHFYLAVMRFVVV